MKKLLFVLVILLSAVLPQQASAAQPVAWGVRASLDINIPGKWNVADNSIKLFRAGAGATVGAVCSIPWTNGFYLEPGISFYYDTYSYDDLIISDTAGNPVEKDPGVHKFGVRVPVVLGYDFTIADSFRMTVFTGPEFNCGLVGKVKTRHKNDFGNGFSDDIYSGDGAQHRFDLAWKIGVGFPVGNFQVGVDAEIGVSDLMPGDVSFRENRANVYLTYYF